MVINVGNLHLPYSDSQKKGRNVGWRPFYSKTSWGRTDWFSEKWQALNRNGGYLNSKRWNGGRYNLFGELLHNVYFLICWNYFITNYFRIEVNINSFLNYFASMFSVLWKYPTTSKRSLHIVRISTLLCCILK